MEEKDTSKTEERKPYTPPVLTEYGSVEDMTQGAAGTANDLPGGSSRSG